MTWKAPKPVIVHFVSSARNLVFDSANSCAEYFTLMGHKLFPENVKRLCNGTGLWSYEENGKTIEVIFDELYDNPFEDGKEDENGK